MIRSSKISHVHKLSLPHYYYMVQIRSKSSTRPKKSTYYRDPDLDRVMELQKKPTLILNLKDIIQSQTNKSILLRDLEKEVGFVQKWTYMAVIEKYPELFFCTNGGNKYNPISVTLTERARKIFEEEKVARELMEPILVRNVRKLLMMAMDCRMPFEKIGLIQKELGLPRDYKETIIFKYPEFFSFKDFNGVTYLCLESWDSELAVTVREERLKVSGGDGSGSSSGGGGLIKRCKVSRDGSFNGPFAFKFKFCPSFRPNTSYCKDIERWQQLPFPSPYLNARRFDYANPQARKRAVAVLHEVLSLTMEKRMSSAQLDAFHNEYQLPVRLLLCLIKNHGLFYITNKGAKSTVFVKDGYCGTDLIDKCPLVRFNNKFVHLGFKRVVDVSNEMALK